MKKLDEWMPRELTKKTCYFIYLFLFILIGGEFLYNTVMVFAIHSHESTMGEHVFPS